MRPAILPTGLAVLTLLCVSACGGGSGGGGGDSGPTFFAWQTFQGASVIIGQGSPTTNQSNQGGGTNGNTLSFPGAPCVGSGRLYIPDQANNRIVGFNAVPTTPNPVADFVLGQTTLMGSTANQGLMVGPTTLTNPWAVCEAGGRLFVSDTGNNRVLIYSTLPGATNAPANLCVGQTNLQAAVSGAGQINLNSPLGIHAVGTRLLVCDTNNHRVLIWNTIPTTNGAPADLVLGQPGFGVNDNLANRGTPTTPARNTLNTPFGVWSDGTRVVVADGFNHRVLIWNTFPTTDGQDADLVLGQVDFTSRTPSTLAAGLDTPTDVTSDGTKLIIGDCENNRLVIHDAFPVSSFTSATTVIGQSLFTLGARNDDNQDGMTDGVGNGNCTARTLSTGSGYAFVTLVGTRLWSGDHRNHRVTAYDGL